MSALALKQAPEAPSIAGRRSVPPAFVVAPAPQLTPGRIIGFAGMIFGMFMAILDIQIVSSSLSEIQAGLSAGPDEISWVQTSYLIAEVVMIPLSGYLSRLLSTRVLFTISAGGFVLSSVACAFATSIDSMIVFRAVQGFIGGAMIPTATATAYIVFPREKMGLASALIGLIATLAPTIGPTVGGYLTELFSWHWLFLINILPGILCVAVVWNFGEVDRPQPELARGMDVLGLAFMALFLGSLEYVLEEGPRQDWLDDTRVLVCAVIALVAGSLFFLRVFSTRNPIVDLRAFRDRNFAVGTGLAFIVGIGLYGSTYLLPLYLARVRGLSALQIGEIMIVTGAFQFLTAPISGILARRIDSRILMLLGLTLMAGAFWTLTGLTRDWSFWELFVPQMLRGIGFMLTMVPVNALALGTLPPHELKNASGLFSLMRNLGGAFGLAGINTVLNDQTALHWQRMTEHLTLTNPAVQAYVDGLAARFQDLVTADPQAVAMKQLAQMAQGQATVMAFGDAFYLIAIFFVAALVSLVLIRKPQNKPAGGAH